MARIGLTQLPRRVQNYVQDHYGIVVDAPNYRKCFDCAVSNRIPAEFLHSRWTVDEADLEKVAIVLGMIPPPKSGLARSTRKSQPTLVA